MTNAPVAIVVVVAALATGCSSETKSALGLPPPPAVIAVQLKDFSFGYRPTVPSGRVVFHVTNVGKVLHNMAVLPLPDDLPPIAEQLRGQERRSVSPFAAMRPVRPAEAREFAVDLAPGTRYALLCSVTDSEGKSHALKGMNSEFRTPASPTRKPPQEKPSGD